VSVLRRLQYTARALEEKIPPTNSLRGFLFSQFSPFCSSRPSVALELNPVAPPMEDAERRPVRPRRFGRRRSSFLVFLATDDACFCVRFCVKMEHFFPYFEKGKSTKKKGVGAPAPKMSDADAPKPRKLNSSVNLDVGETLESTKISLSERCTTCYAHYSVYLYENGTKKSSLRFSTRDEGEDEQLPLALFIGQPNARHVASEGVDACLRMMENVGERASFVLPPSLGYGDAGNVSFPSIPPKSELLVEIELLHAEGTAERPDTVRTELTFEKRMERCENLKQKGNEKFRGGSKKAATRLYESGLSYITEDLMQQLMLPKHVDLAEGLRATLRLNMAGCYLGLKEYALCIKYCDLARGEGVWGDAAKRCCDFRKKEEDSCWLTKPQQVKAMFRKAQALEHMPGERYEEAMDVLREVKESLGAELERLYIKANGRNPEEGVALGDLRFEATDPEEAKLIEMFRNDYLLSAEKVNRLIKLIEKREKMSMADFCGVFEKKI